MSPLRGTPAMRCDLLSIKISAVETFHLLLEPTVARQHVSTATETTTVQLVQSTRDNMVHLEQTSIRLFLIGHLISATHPEDTVFRRSKAKLKLQSDPSFTSTFV